MTMKNPWLGLKSYEEGDRLYGRGKETDELANIVINSFHTIIYGKSGIGKTSLLRAGVFPALRYEDFLPIYVRLEHDENADEDYYLRQIDNALKENQCLSSEKIENALSLQSIFSRYNFSKSRGIELTPVIVFDQFEEIFTLNESRTSVAVERFFADLSIILNGNLDGYNYRLVFCLREDYLYYMERLSESIPAFKRNRYCLQDLTREEAMEVITCSCEGMVDDGVAEDVLKKISSDGATVVNATILSLYMAQLYDKMEKAGAYVISSELVQTLGEDIISAFYFQSIEGISEKTIEYLEDHLVTTGGYRHNVPLEDAIVTGVRLNEVERLKNCRIINLQPRQGNVPYVEYAHDVLCPIIVENRDKRALRKKTKRQKRMISAAVVALVCMIGIVGVFVWQNYKIKQKQEEMLLMQSRAIAGQAEQLYQKGFYTFAAALCLAALPKDIEHPDRPFSNDVLVTLSEALYSESSNCDIVISHGDVVNSAAFNPNGKYIVTSSADGMARVWNVRTGKLVRTFKGHKGSVEGAEFSPDGKFVLTYSEDNTTKIWDVESGRLINTLKGSVKYAGFGSNRHIAVTVNEYNNTTELKIWNTSNGKLLRTLKKGSRYHQSFCMTSDGKYVFSSFEDSTVTIWNVNTGKETRLSDCLYVNESLKGHILLIASMKDWSFSLCDIETGRLIKKIKSEGAINFKFSPDYRNMAYCGRNSGVNIYDVVTGKQLMRFGEDRKYDFLSYSPDGRSILAEGNNGKLFIYDVATGKQMLCFENDIKYESSSYSPKGRYVLTGCSDFYLVWNAESGKFIKAIDQELGQTLQFSPDDRFALICNCDEVRLWDLKKKETINRVYHNEYDDYKVQCSDMVCPDGRNLLEAVCYEDTVIIVNVNTGKHIRKFYIGDRDSYYENLSLSLSPNAYYLIERNGSEDVIKCWNTRTGKCIYQSKYERGGEFIVDNRYLAFQYDYHTSLLIDLVKGKLIQTIKSDSREIRPLAFSPDGSRIVTYFSDFMIREYEVITGRQVKTYKSFGFIDTEATFSMDGKYFAVASDNQDVRIFEYRTGKLLNTLSCENSVCSFCFNTDSRYLLVKGDGVIYIYDLKAGVKITENRNRGFFDVRFSSDGKYIVYSEAKYFEFLPFYRPQEIINHFRKTIGNFMFSEEDSIKYYLK